MVFLLLIRIYFYKNIFLYIIDILSLFSISKSTSLCLHKEVLFQGNMTFVEFLKSLDETDNSIVLEKIRYIIGKNTLQSIYPQKNHGHPWLDVPHYPPKSIIMVHHMKNVIQGILSSNEANQKELEWEKININKDIK